MRRFSLFLLVAISFSSFANTSLEISTAEKSIVDTYRVVIGAEGPISFISHSVQKENFSEFNDPELKDKTFLVTSRFTVNNKLQIAKVGIYCEKENVCESLYTQPGL